MERSWSGVFARFAQPDRQRPDDELSLEVPDAKEDEGVEMTSYDVKSRRFGRQLLGGLNPSEVTAFLDEVAEALHTAQRRYIETEAQLRLLESEGQAVAPSERDEGKDDAPAATRLELLRSTALEEVEVLLHDAQARAQAVTDAARNEAERLVAEATATVDSILTTAREQEAALRKELDRLAESRLRMLDDLWATLTGCQEWLASVDPRRRGPDEPEGRLDRVA
jgi:DivIVA domain-containing protein